MADPGEHLGAFTARLHRRLVCLRAIEGAGLGLAAGAVLGLFLAAILMYRSEPAAALVICVLPLAAFTGAAWALLRRPRALSALQRADRQLGLSDLLSTAWAIQRSPNFDEQFARAVLHTAQARAAEISPASIMLHRLGRRGWSAIGLATALALAMGLISANPVDSPASAAQRPVVLRNASAKAPSKTAGGAGSSASGRTPEAVADHAGDDNRSLDTKPDMATGTVRDPAQSNAISNGTDPNGAGGGFARSIGRAMVEWFPSLAARGNTAAPGADAATGQDPSANAANANALPPAPPWTGSGWSAARDAATSAIRDGRVPAAYHDLVRDYFQRD